MDIRVLSRLAGATSSAAAVAVPADSRAIISEIASSTTLGDSARSGLIAAVAQVDSGLTGVTRSDALQITQRLGIYLRNSGTEGYPRWPMMTALRAYGMNLTNNADSMSDVGQAAIISNLKSHLEQIAQGHGVSLQKAIAATSALPLAQANYKPPVKPVEVHADAPLPVDTGTRVEKIV